MLSDPVTWTQQTSTGLYPSLQPPEDERPTGPREERDSEAGVGSPTSAEVKAAEDELLVARPAAWVPGLPGMQKKEQEPTFHVTLFHYSVGVDTIEKYTTYLVMLIEFFKLIMACLLAVFVPQRCSASSPYAMAARRASGDGECSFEENFMSASPYNTFVLVWNFGTLAVCLIHRSLTSQREAFMVDHFDADPRLPHENIREVLRTNPTIGGILTDWNKRVYTSAVAFMTVNILNFIFSAILVWSRNSGYRTTTVFLTNVLLLAQLLFWDLSVARASWKGDEAVSLVRRDNRRYNALDHRKCTDTGVCEVTGLNPIVSV